MKAGALTGLAIGDALGAPWEFKNPTLVRQANWKGDFVATPRSRLKAGQWTDDTKMALALSFALVDSAAFDPEVVASKYIGWYNSGDLRGIGNQTNTAISNMIMGEELNKCGAIDNTIGYRDSRYCGNGTVMRVAPIGIFLRDNIDEMIKAAAVDAILTHDHIDAVDSSVALCLAMQIQDPEDLLKELSNHISTTGNVYTEIKRATELIGNDPYTVGSMIKNDGCAHRTIASALWCAWKYPDNFRDSVVEAVKMGGDADTRAAITGAIMGAKLGFDGIPKEYIKGVEDTDLLFNMDQALFAGPDGIKNARK